MFTTERISRCLLVLSMENVCQTSHSNTVYDPINWLCGNLQTKWRNFVLIVYTHCICSILKQSKWVYLIKTKVYSINVINNFFYWIKNATGKKTELQYENIFATVQYKFEHIGFGLSWINPWSDFKWVQGIHTQHLSVAHVDIVSIRMENSTLVE